MSYPPVPAAAKLPQPAGTPSDGDVAVVSQVSPLELEWSATSGGNAGGDLSGTYPDPVVERSSAATFTVDGTMTVGGYLTAETGGAFNGAFYVGGFIDVYSPGGGLQVAEGANAKQGTAVLAAGTVTVANTAVFASSRIFITAQSLGTVATPQALAVTARIPGTSFTITSASATDTSTVAYEIFEPG
jgi:hypothetical protein